MKKFTAILLFLIPTVLFAETDMQKSTLYVIVDGIPSIEGQIKILLTREGEDSAFRKETAPVKSNTWTWTQNDVPYGRYSIKVYHDRNGNGELDKNVWGIPSEAYGFSNNARSMTGPPNTKDTLFQVAEPELTLKITLH